MFDITGEQFEEPNVIGATLSMRTKERLLQVWLRDGRNEKVRTNVSNKIRHFLNLDANSVTLYYKEHIKSIKVSILVLLTYIQLSIVQDGSTMKNAEGFKFMKAGQRAPYSSSGSYHQQQRGPKQHYNNGGGQ